MAVMAAERQQTADQRQATVMAEWWRMRSATAGGDEQVP
jgi:hypothetical protein